MKTKNIFLSIVLFGGLVYFASNTAALITTQTASTTAIVLSVCTIVSYAALACAIIFSLFAKNRKRALLLLWSVCLVFVVLFFTEHIVTNVDAIDSFKRTLDTLPDAAVDAVKPLENNIAACTWRIAGSAVFMICAVAFSIFKIIKSYLRPVNAE